MSGATRRGFLGGLAGFLVALIAAPWRVVTGAVRPRGPYESNSWYCAWAGEWRIPGGRPFVCHAPNRREEIWVTSADGFWEYPFVVTRVGEDPRDDDLRHVGYFLTDDRGHVVPYVEWNEW